MRTGFVYEFKSKDKSITGTYIGSTWDIKKRYWCHNYNYNNEKNKEYNYPLYRYIRENGGFDNFEMTIIDSGECEEKLQRFVLEQLYIDKYGLDNLLNRKNAYTTKEAERERAIKYAKEYRETHKKKISDNAKKFREKHKVKISLDRKEKMLCECGIIITKVDKAKHYRTQLHINKINNIVIVPINHDEKMVCECGGRYIRKHKPTHIKTNKHQKYIKNNKLI